MKLYLHRVVTFEVLNADGYPIATFYRRRDARRFIRRTRKVNAS